MTDASPELLAAREAISKKREADGNVEVARRARAGLYDGSVAVQDALRGINEYVRAHLQDGLAVPASFQQRAEPFHYCDGCDGYNCSPEKGCAYPTRDTLEADGLETWLERAAVAWRGWDVERPLREAAAALSQLQQRVADLTAERDNWIAAGKTWETLAAKKVAAAEQRIAELESENSDLLTVIAGKPRSELG